MGREAVFFEGNAKIVTAICLFLNVNYKLNINTFSIFYQNFRCLRNNNPKNLMKNK